MKVIGYTYDADYHCKDCTYKYAREQALKEVNDLIKEWMDNGDKIELAFDPQDSEGNPLHPIFDTDEWYANDIYVGSSWAVLHCSDCGAEMDTWEAS